MKYGDRVKFLRIKKNMSLCNLAKSAGISKSTLSNIENNISICKIDTLKKICYTLGVDESVILNDKDFDYYLFNLHLTNLLNSNYISSRLKVSDSDAKEILVSFINDSIILNN